MDINTLRQEFLWLSKVYPELRHGLVIGDENWISMRLPSADVRMFGALPLKVINAYVLNSDRFARVYCLWHGSPDEDRECDAEAEFHRLAQIAAGLVEPKEFSSRGGPVQVTVRSGVCAVKVGDEECMKMGIPQVRIPLINQWVCHVIIANGVVRRPCEAHSGGVVGKCQAWLLPRDSFIASANALAEQTASGPIDPRAMWIYSRWQYEAKTGTEIFKDYEQIRSAQGWPIVNGWDALRKCAQRYAEQQQLPFRKSKAGRPKNGD